MIVMMVYSDIQVVIKSCREFQQTLVLSSPISLRARQQYSPSSAAVTPTNFKVALSPSYDMMYLDFKVEKVILVNLEGNFNLKIATNEATLGRTFPLTRKLVVWL